MNCEQCKKFQIACLLQELTNSERELVDAHRQECNSCQLEYEAINNVWHALDKQEEQQPSPLLQENFHSMLNAELASGSSMNNKIRQQKSIFQFIWPSKPAWAFSYSFALLLGGILMGNILPQASLWSRQNEISPFAQFDYSNIPEDRLIQICSVQNPQYFKTL